MKTRFTLPNGSIVETELEFGQLKELLGVNGHATPGRLQSFPLESVDFFAPQYNDFKKCLTPKAKQFLAILKQNPNGISADHIAERLGFTAPVQIGGMAGGGMKKWANKYHVDLANLYKREIRFEDGERKVIYRPGKDIDLAT